MYNRADSLVFFFFREIFSIARFFSSIYRCSQTAAKSEGRGADLCNAGVSRDSHDRS